MSWQIEIAKTPAANFSAAVDAAPVPHQGNPADPQTGVADDVAIAKEALKALATRIKSPYVSGQTNGHALQESQNVGQFYDGITVSVSGHAS